VVGELRKIMKLQYTKGYKYQLAENYEFEFIQNLTKTSKRLSNLMFIRCEFESIKVLSGYAWDGPSGPTKDTKTNMRASLEHDVLYQLIRFEILPRNLRKAADLQFDKTAKEDGMSWWRRKYYLFALRKFAGFAASPKSKKRVYVCGR